MDDTIGISLTGYGNIGRVHAYAYQSLPDLDANGHRFSIQPVKFQRILTWR